MTQNIAFKKWYDKNKQKHNVKRKERYKHDVLYRTSVQAKSRAFKMRLANQKKENKGTNLCSLAALLGVSVLTIKNWEVKEYTHKPQNAKGMREYSKHHVSLITNFYNYIKKYPTSSKVYIEKSIEASVILKGAWDDNTIQNEG